MKLTLDNQDYMIIGGAFVVVTYILLRIVRALGNRQGSAMKAALAELDADLKVANLSAMERGAIQRRRAQLLHQLGRHKEALPAAQEAFKTCQDVENYTLLAVCQLKTGKAAAAARSVAGLVNSLPYRQGVIETFGHDWVAQLLNGVKGKEHAEERFELLVALAKDGYAAPRAKGAPDQNFIEAVAGLIERARLTEARELVRQSKDQITLRAMRKDRRFTGLQP